MEINNPNDLLKAIQAMLLQMNRQQRNQFLKWVKRHKNDYDFNFPQGYVYKPETDPLNGPTVEQVQVAQTPVIVPATLADIPKGEINA